jgi:hypothetical protein
MLLGTALSILIVSPLTDALAQSQNALPYAEALKDYQARGLTPTQDVEIIIHGENFTRQGGGKALINQNLGGITGRSVQWGDTEGHWLEWEFNAPQSGLYNIAVHYYPKAIEDPYLTPLYMIRSLTIDGRYPFKEMEEVKFSHIWEKNKEEEETRRVLKAQDIDLEVGLWAIGQKPQWRLEVLSDFSTGLLDPYLFYLEKGQHTLRMKSIARPVGQYQPRSEAIDVDYIVAYSPKKIPTYKEAAERYIRDGIRETKGIVVKVEGEDHYAQGGPGERTNNTTPGDPIRGGEYTSGAVPFIRAGGEPEENFYNSLGNWYQPGHWIEWKFNVPEEGLYKIVFKYFQGTISPIPLSLRGIKIDGEHPFEEMKSYPFRYAGGRYNYSIRDNAASRIVVGERVVVRWGLHTLSDAEGKPYLFHLTPGGHTLEIKPVLGPVLSEAIGNINLARQEIVQLETKVSEIIARGVDTNSKSQTSNSKSQTSDSKKVDVTKEIPDLQERIDRMLTSLREVARSLTAFNGGVEPPIVESIKMINEELVGIARKPNVILELLDPNRLDPSVRLNIADQATAFARTLRGQIESLSGPQLQLQAALDIDYIAITSPDVEPRFPPRAPFRSFVKGWNRFIKSFSQEE